MKKLQKVDVNLFFFQLLMFLLYLPLNVYEVNECSSTFIVIMICFHISGEFEYFVEPFVNTETNIGKISVAFYQGLFAYNGW